MTTIIIKAEIKVAPSPKMLPEPPLATLQGATGAAAEEP